MKISTLKSLTSKLPAEFSVLIRGRHGIGKSAAVAQIAKELGLPLIDRRLSQMTEGDLLGLPSTAGGVTTFNPPDWIHRACTEAVVLFLDELNRAVAEVIQGAFQLCNDRALNGRKLHPGTRVFVAVNDGAQYQVNDMDPALLDRFFVVDAECEPEDWLKWAKDEGGVIPLVIDFIAAQRSALLPAADESGRVSGSPRSWDRLSQALKSFGLADSPDDPVFYQLAAGFVGPELAQAFTSFARKFDTKLDPLDIIMRGRTDEVKKKIAKATPEKHMLLIQGIIDWVEAQTVQSDDVPGSVDGFTEDMAENIRPFYDELSPENRVKFHVGVMAIAEKPNGVAQLPKIVFFHSKVVDLLLDVFGTKLGEAGVGIQPVIPQFLQKDAA